MDRAASRGPRPGPPGSLLHGSCNYLQNVVAISYIFVLQLPTFLLCSIHYCTEKYIHPRNIDQDFLHFAKLLFPPVVSYPDNTP